MKYCLIIGMVFILIMSCKTEFSKSDLPSVELIDTLIKESIIQSNINNLKLSQKQLDSFERIQFPISHYKLYRKVNNYAQRITNQSEVNDIKELSSDYLLSPRFKIGSDFIFSINDTSYISYQILNSKSFLLKDSMIANVSLIDSNEIKKAEQIQMIARAKKYFYHFNYLEIYTPLLNKNKNVAIVGICGYNLSNPIIEGYGNYIVLKRNGNRWTKIEEIMWWSN